MSVIYVMLYQFICCKDTTIIWIRKKICRVTEKKIVILQIENRQIMITAQRTFQPDSAALAGNVQPLQHGRHDG